MAGPQNRDTGSLKHPQFGRPIGKMISDISCLQELSIPVADHTIPKDELTIDEQPYLCALARI